MVTMDADFQKGCTKQMWILARENGKLSVTGGTLFVYRDDIDLVLADTLIFDGGCEGLLTSHKAVLLSRLVPVANPTLVGLSRGQIGLVLPAAEFQDILSQFQPVPIWPPCRRRLRVPLILPFSNLAGSLLRSSGWRSATGFGAAILTTCA